MSLVDIDVCQGKNGDGCGGSFPNKVSHGLCAKCFHLSKLTEGSVEYTSWQAVKQCLGCGLAWRNLTADTCGRCTKGGTKEIHPPPSQTSGAGQDSQSQTVLAALEASRAARAHALDARLSHKPTSSSTPSLHSTEGLIAAKANVNPASGGVFISFECRVRSSSRREQTHLHTDCGVWGRTWMKTDFMSEVLDDALETLNNTWTKQYQIALNRDEVELRAQGNKIFHPGASTGTVGKLYNDYMTGDMATYYGTGKAGTKNRNPSVGGLKGTLTMPLEIFINRPKFLERQESLNNMTESLPPSRKRGRALTTSLDINTKRQAAHDGVLQSSFVRTPRVPSGTVTATSTSVGIQKAHVTCDARTGQVDITWPDDPTKNVLQGLIEKSSFISGTTKKVYKLSIGADLYVAKRFFDVGEGDEADVSSAQNEELLKSELVRLRSAEWFLKKFFDHAKIKSVEISSDIAISNGYLVREIGAPSPASGLDLLDEDNSAIWLVEPRRTKSVVKFSGTLVHPNRQDKLGITLSAFAHFVYDASHKEIILADIQGSPMNINGRDSMVLFDMMTHTPDGDSGLGDHGKMGIETFVDQHTCNHVCAGLYLSKLEAEAEKEDEVEGHGGNNRRSSTPRGDGNN